MGIDEQITDYIAARRFVPQDDVVIIVQGALPLKRHKRQNRIQKSRFGGVTNGHQKQKVQRDVKNAVEVSSRVRRRVFGPRQFTVHRIQDGFEDEQKPRPPIMAFQNTIHRPTDEATRTARQVSRAVNAVNDNPQSLIYGNGPIAPGPGEPGFTPPGGKR